MPSKLLSRIEAVLVAAVEDHLPEDQHEAAVEGVRVCFKKSIPVTISAVINACVEASWRDPEVPSRQAAIAKIREEREKAGLGG